MRGKCEITKENSTFCGRIEHLFLANCFVFFYSQNRCDDDGWWWWRSRERIHVHDQQLIIVSLYIFKFKIQDLQKLRKGALPIKVQRERERDPKQPARQMTFLGDNDKKEEVEVAIIKPPAVETVAG